MTVPLKHTEAFSAVYRRGRWARGPSLSVGILPNRCLQTRIGLRTRRGLTGAVVRNRLKRQLRTIVYDRALPFRQGLDVVVVIHPVRLPAATDLLKTELIGLCKRAGALA